MNTRRWCPVATPVFSGSSANWPTGGVEVHFFTGNHDIWCGDYLVKGMRRDAAHRADDGGDGRQGVHAGARRRFGRPRPQVPFPACRVPQPPLLTHVFLHPSPLGCGFRSVLGGAQPPEAWCGRRRPPYLGEDKEYLVRFAKEYLKAHSEINYFIFRPSSHRAGLDADPFEPCPDSG